MMNGHDHDQRIVYGANCAWWDGIEKIGRIRTASGRSLPCCPFCKGMLFEMPSPKEWWDSVEAHQAKGNAGYRAFIEWLKGKHFASYGDAITAYMSKPGRTVL